MQSSVLSGVGFDDDEDDNYVVGSSTSCWRYTGEEQEEALTTENESRIDSIDVHVKKEIIEDVERPIIKSITTPSVGCVSTIKNKSKSEREYSATAVKKLNDLLRGSEFSSDESEYTNRLIVPQRPQAQEYVFSNRNSSRPETSQSVPTRVPKETTLATQYVPKEPTLATQYVPKEPTLTTQYVPREPTLATKYMPKEPTLANQYVPTRVPEEISSSSIPGAGQASTSDPGPRKIPSPTYGYVEPDHMIQNQGANSSYQNNVEVEKEQQVIKLIHTSDATLPYMCSACNMHSSNLGVMKQHIADHKKGVIKCPLLGLSKNVFICPFGNCEFSSPNYARVLTHLNRFHGSVAQHLIKQITNATLPEAVEALNDPVAPLSKRESIWKGVSFTKKPQSKIYACSECDFKDYDYKTVIQHLHEHIAQNKKQKVG